MHLAAPPDPRSSSSANSATASSPSPTICSFTSAHTPTSGRTHVISAARPSVDRITFEITGESRFCFFTFSVRRSRFGMIKSKISFRFQLKLHYRSRYDQVHLPSGRRKEITKDRLKNEVSKLLSAIVGFHSTDQTEERKKSRALWGSLFWEGLWAQSTAYRCQWC